MDDSLITHPSESSARSWELGITTPHPPTHKLMDKQKLQTDLLKIIKTQLEQEAKRWKSSYSYGLRGSEV